MKQVLVTVLFSVLFLILGLIIGFSSPSSITETGETISAQEFEYIRDNSCRLYGNYRDLYLAADDICNSSTTCRGSAKQLQGQRSYASWDIFRDTYCEN